MAINVRDIISSSLYLDKKFNSFYLLLAANGAQMPQFTNNIFGENTGHMIDLYRMLFKVPSKKLVPLCSKLVGKRVSELVKLVGFMRTHNCLGWTTFVNSDNEIVKEKPYDIESCVQVFEYTAELLGLNIPLQVFKDEMTEERWHWASLKAKAALKDKKKSKTASKEVQYEE